MKLIKEIPNQKKLLNAIEDVPIEYFKWGSYPDHFTIDMPHRHEFSELIFFIKGGGVNEIDFKDHKALHCSIHYIPKSVVHCLRRDISSDGFTIAFDSDFLEKNDYHKSVVPFSFEPFVLNLDESRFKEILLLTDVIRNQLKMENGYYKKKCFLLSIELLLNKLANFYNQQEEYEERSDENTTIRDFKILVKTNVHNYSSVSWYADKLNISPKSLSNHVKNNLGISAKNYITKSVLSSVKKSLIDTNKNINQITIEHNYTNTRLCKLFKKHVGYTMQEYRSI